jgi:hypothetical protein
MLEELLEGFGVRIRYQAIKQDQNLAYVAGGLCVLNGEYVLIVNSSASTSERVITLATGLKHFDLDKVYIRPDVRQLLDKIPEQRPFNISST